MVKAVSVSQLNGYIKRILATDPILCNVSVQGEMTNLTRHSSGHWYFSLKDEQSTIRCFLARDRVAKLRFELEEGMKLTAYGGISVYERGGSYSLNIRDIEVEGEGELKKAFELLMKKLSAEGLFDEAHKRELPAFPKRIGVVTSPTGAAIKDIITTVRRRNPLTDILLYPCLVQGPDAAESICKGIKCMNEQFGDLDLLIVGRGGGSAEDLWCFNEESVARAVYNSQIPVISAVGHEIDYLISDYVADLRAATPTAAAELAVPDISYYMDIIYSCNPGKMYKLLLENYDDNLRHINHLKEMNDASCVSVFNNALHKLSILKLELEAYNPYAQLEKGYAIAKGMDKKWVSKVDDLSIGDEFELILKGGSLKCLVEEKN